jgi:hypothetical protein
MVQNSNYESIFWIYSRKHWKEETKIQDFYYTLMCMYKARMEKKY